MKGKTNAQTGSGLEGEILNISLTTNQSSHSDIIGAVITVTHPGGTSEYTWNGSPISVEIPPYVDYSVAFATVDGYTAPDTYSSTAVAGNSVTITQTYKTTVVTVSLTDNQTSYNDIASATATVSGALSATLSNGGTIKVPFGKSITVKGSSVSGYKTPSTTYTAADAAKTLTLTWQTEILTVKVAGDGGTPTGYTAYVKNSSGTTLGSQTTASKTYKIPYGTSYYVQVTDVDGFVTPANSSTYTASGSSNASRTVIMTYTYSPVMITGIVLNQSITDPAAMITRTTDGGAIEAIRANSHRYLGKYTAEGTMTICQLDDTDSTKYADGTAADLTGGEGDVFMKLPQFYYSAIESSTGQWEIYFAFGGKPDDSFVEWDGTDLIGVYEAYNSSSKVYSRSGVASTGSVSQANFKAYARNRGTGFSIVKWKHHSIMAFLYYAMYGHMNCQAQIGAGTDSYQKPTGQTDSLGMEDTVAGVNGDSQSINFWGLENWWGNKYEWVDNVVVNNQVWNITEDDGTVRTVSAGASSGHISKVAVGECLDVIPIAASGSATTGFCDYYWQSSSSSRVVLRSYSGSRANGGVAYAVAYGDSSDTYSDAGSRLAFRGVLVEAESVSAYQSTEAIG